MVAFLKVKIIAILLSIALWVLRNKNNYFPIRCATKFYINVIKHFLYIISFFSFKDGLKYVPIFLFDSEFFFFFKIFYFLLCVDITKRRVKRQTQIIFGRKSMGAYYGKEEGKE
jgi:hypothetical protein